MADPTARELAQLCRLRKRAGSTAELARWIVLAETTPARARGQPRGDRYGEEDYELITLAEDVFRTGRALDGGEPPPRRRTPWAVISYVVEQMWRPALGAQKVSVKRRLLGRLGPLTITAAGTKYRTTVSPYSHLEIARALMSPEQRDHLFVARPRVKK